MRVGLVLSSTPSYSETFFRSKIRGLIDSGIEVVLFVKNDFTNNDFPCSVRIQPKLAHNFVLKTLQSFYYFTHSIFIKSRENSTKLFREARENELSIIDAIGQVVIAYQILPEKLDWLHFGFATNAEKRELIAKSIGAKMAVSVRGYDIAVYPLKHRDPFKLLWKNIDKLHSISYDLLKEAYINGFDKKQNFKIITPAIDVNQFSNLQDNRQSGTILSVGRLHWKKGIEYLLSSLAQLQSKDIEFSLTIVGEGDEKERLMFCVDQLNLADKVKFIGKVDHDTVAKLMKTHSILVQYSIQEGFCNTVLEAQASGMLCVVSDAEGLPENVENEKTGWVVKKRRPKLLASKLEEVMNLSESKSNAIRKLAIERVEDEFSIEKQKREFIDFYSS